MILYIENAEGSIKKNLLGLINECSKIKRYRVNRKKNYVFLCTNNKLEKYF